MASFLGWMVGAFCSRLVNMRFRLPGMSLCFLLMFNFMREGDVFSDIQVMGSSLLSSSF